MRARVFAARSRRYHRSSLRGASGFATCIAILLILGSAGLGVPARSSILPDHLVLARELLREVTPDTTSYRHRPTVVRWQAPEHVAACFTDCSGLLNTILARAYGLNSHGVSRWLGARRPLARDYEAAIAGDRAFTSIINIRDISPGDLLAMRFPAGERNTGHAMIADGPATPLSPSAPISPVIAGATQWSLPIIDCTGSPHGTSDTRRIVGDTTRSGLGRGTFRLYVDAFGTITGWAWSDSARSIYRPCTRWPLAIGRVDESALLRLTNTPDDNDREPTPPAPVELDHD